MDSPDPDFAEMLETEERSARPTTYRAHALLVAGMHRTGTSALTRVLNLRGIDLPRNLAPAVPGNNDLGFWESVPIAEAHDRFLASVGSAWDDVSPIHGSVFSSSKGHVFAEELEEILGSEYGDSTFFVVKDPRLCRLIPAWVNALRRFGARPSFVITVRNPLEVAGSLRARDGFSATKSCLLWLRHLLDAERDTRGFPRVFVSYEHLLRDWVSTTDQIARELHLFWPRCDHETNLQIEAFLSSALRHHRYEVGELQARSDVIDWVKQVFDAVYQAAVNSDEIDGELFDELRGQLDRADQAYGPLLVQARSEISQRDAARHDVESELARLAAELAERQDELSSLRADNQLVVARFIEEIEATARLRGTVDGLAEMFEELCRGLSECGAPVLSSRGEARMLRPATEQLIEDLRARATADGEPQQVGRLVDQALTHVDKFLALLDHEAQRVAAALATRETELANAIRRAEEAEAEARDRTGALRAAVEERDRLKDEGARLSAALGEYEESLVIRTRDYDELRAEAQSLAEAVSATQTELADLRLRLNSALADAADLREALAEREKTIEDTLTRFQVAEREASARERRLRDALAEREEALLQARVGLDAAETRLRAIAGELDRARVERESDVAEAKRLTDALDERTAELMDLRRAFGRQQAELAQTRRRLETVEAEAEAAARQLQAALAESETTLRLTQVRLEAVEEEAERRGGELEKLLARRDALRSDHMQLQAELGEQERALSLAQTENARLHRSLGEHEERHARGLEEARKLALAVAESEEALMHRTVELRDRDEQLSVVRSEIAARDELLARHSELVDTLSADLRIRDETLAVQSELLMRLDAIGRTRKRRWRSFSQFCSWVFPPTAAHLDYIKSYLRLRHSDLFDPDYYLARYPDVSHAGLNPLMHYVEHGRREGRSAVGSLAELPFIPTPSPRPSASALTLPVASESMPSELAGPPDQTAADDTGALHHELAHRVPRSAVIAVAVGGEEEEPLSLDEHRTVRFPSTPDETPGGDRACGDTALIASLEAMRAAGADFLYVPTSQQLLLERHPRFRAHLTSRYARVFGSDELGLCVALRSLDPSSAWRRELADLAEWVERQTASEASILDWDSGLQLDQELQGFTVFRFSERALPHLDASVDVVAVVASSAERLAEASRVAHHAVLEVPAYGASPSHLTVSPSFAIDAPSVSIVIPCHDQLAHTRACLRALDETLPTWFRGEILVVDDASSSDTVADLQHLADSSPHVRLLRNKANAGFLASVNRAVHEAVGEFVVLLNNDTIPLPGWLPPLIAPFRTREDVGAVGGRLVYPDGRLQEAGGLVFRDGSAAKFGYGDPEPDFPLFTMSREVDYCSGCLLAFRRDFFLESGGFDPAYGFGFYEDTDFCFRVRALGQIVLYEPESVVVHVEGASAGTDLTQGAKRFQALNASLFTERWQEALTRQHERPAELDRAALRQLATRAERR